MERVALEAEFRRVRAATTALCSCLENEDYVVQPIEDVSPPKWHLGHTTWFFETFVLGSYDPDFEANEEHAAVFNSYYRTVGDPYPRARRGTRSRPTVREVLAYRDYVDEAVLRLIARAGGAALAELLPALTLGLHHEQQHQELLAADIKFILRHNGVEGPWAAAASATPALPPARRLDVDGGVFPLGHAGEGFAFDNERPRHDVLVRPFSLAQRPVTRGEYAQFIAAGGYRDFRHWLSDGWDRVNAERWTAPLHWDEEGDPAEPVCHLSYYEADAFARWAGGRLPTEAEWELAAASLGGDPARGRFLEDGAWRPRPAGETPDGAAAQLFGDVWEWTSSAYGAYPGFKPLSGAFGEYNGKFMSGQFVLRGGSCATPRGHVRRSYRNFFQPEKRWQFTGVRLAWDR